MFKNHKKAIISLFVVGVFIVYAWAATKYWIANYYDAEVTASEATAVAELADAIDGITTAQSDQLLVLSSSSTTASEVSQSDISGYFVYVNDFVGDILFPTSTGAANGWQATGDATYDVLSAAGTLGGWCLLAPEAGSNNELYLQMGQLGTETFVEATSASAKAWLIEFNLTPSSVTNAASWFVGLADESAEAANFINDDGDDFADEDVILMGVFEGDPNGLQCLWQTTGAAFDTAASGTVNITAKNYTLGIGFDGATTVTYYVDGLALATQAITATGFPDTEELSPIIAMKQGATAININLDWIRLVSAR